MSDQACEFVTQLDPKGEDVSGLAFDPTNPSVLWAVQNKEWLWKLVKVNGQWIPDATRSATGKEIFFSGGPGQPDSEGLTVGGNGNVYLTSERDNQADSIPKDTILEFDPTTPTTTLTPSGKTT